jgi:hypothetical protein
MLPSFCLFAAIDCARAGDGDSQSHATNTTVAAIASLRLASKSLFQWLQLEIFAETEWMRLSVNFSDRRAASSCTMLIGCRCWSFRTCVFVCVPPSQDVLVLGRYTSMDHATLSLRDGRPDPDGLRSAIKVTVTDPRQDVLLTHDTTAEGKFAFTSVVGGEHLICLATNTTSWYGQQRNFVSYCLPCTHLASHFVLPAAGAAVFFH